MTLTWQEFGKQLIESKDLDPVYVVLHGAGLPDPILKRYCLAYFCFYDMGTAARIAEYSDFWKGCQKAYDEKWPRGTERRHYRGQQCLDSLNSLRSVFRDPEKLVDWLCFSRTFEDVQNKTKEMRGFGPWITWKIADILERVLGIPIDFSNASLMMYSEPVAGAAMILGKKDKKVTTQEMQAVLELMQVEFGSMLAPPSYDRHTNIAEWETILCKSKSHTNGHYPVGHDIAQLHRTLSSTPSDLAKELLSFVPPLVISKAKTLF